MTVKCLTEEQKDMTVRLFNSGSPQQGIAAAMGVSRDTIRRCLIEEGLLQAGKGRKVRVVDSLSEDDRAILRLVKEKGLTSYGLTKVLATPVLTGERVVQALSQLDNKGLSTVLEAVRAKRQKGTHVDATA